MLAQAMLDRARFEVHDCDLLAVLDGEGKPLTVGRHAGSRRGVLIGLLFLDRALKFARFQVPDLQLAVRMTAGSNRLLVRVRARAVAEIFSVRSSLPVLVSHTARPSPSRQDRATIHCPSAVKWTLSTMPLNADKTARFFLPAGSHKVTLFFGPAAASKLPSGENWIDP